MYFHLFLLRFMKIYEDLAFMIFVFFGDCGGVGFCFVMIVVVVAFFRGNV